MTTEEKAKAYDEAMKQAKNELKTCGSMDCDAARQIFRFFPDLKESENERIRKDIIALIKFGITEGSAVSPGSHTTKEEALAYLERQKECVADSDKTSADEDERIRKKLIGIFTNQSLCDVYNLKSEDVLAYLERMKEDNGLEFIPIENTLEYKAGFAAGQKEQKPNKDTGFPSVTKFVYNKSDEEFIRDCANILKGNDYGVSAERLLSMLEQKPVDDFEKWLDDWYQGSKELGGNVVMSEKEFKNWSRGIKNMFDKPVKWSEEDLDKVRHALIGTYAVDTAEYLFDKVRGSQPKVEWSEEDDIHREWILECLADGKRKVPEYAEQYQSAFNWLKSLRPSWKPSEEQLKALKDVIPGLMYPIDTEPPVNHLKELYEQLKKL